MGTSSVGGGPTVPGGDVPSSLPWQDRQEYGSAIDAMFKTVRAVLVEPSDAFARVRVDGSLGSSMLYVVILGTLGGIAALLWQGLARAGVAAMMARVAPEAAAFQVTLTGAILVASMVFIPLVMVVAPLINALILHACLLLVGGANKPFEATYAVVAYSSGSTALFQLVPFCGGLIGFVWQLVAEIIGLAQVHQCGVGRAVFAVLLPLALCCTCAGAMIVMLVGLGAAQAG